MKENWSYVSFLQDFSKGKGSSLHLIYNAHTALLICGADKHTRSLVKVFTCDLGVAQAFYPCTILIKWWDHIHSWSGINILSQLILLSLKSTCHAQGVSLEIDAGCKTTSACPSSHETNHMRSHMTLISLHWVCNTKSELWSHHCTSWSQDWLENERYNAPHCCDL